MSMEEINAADLRELAASLGVRPARRSKYGNRAVVIDGHRFDSQREGDVYLKLKALEVAGTISRLELHPPIRCEVNGVLVCEYRADFGFVENGIKVIVDVKGVRTATYKLKKKLVRALHGIEIMEW